MVIWSRASRGLDGTLNTGCLAAGGTRSAGAEEREEREAARLLPGPNHSGCGGGERGGQDQARGEAPRFNAHPARVFPARAPAQPSLRKACAGLRAWDSAARSPAAPCPLDVRTVLLHRWSPRSVQFALVFVATFSFPWFTEVACAQRFRSVASLPLAPPPSPAPLNSFRWTRNNTAFHAAGPAPRERSQLAGQARPPARLAASPADGEALRRGCRAGLPA